MNIILRHLMKSLMSIGIINIVLVLLLLPVNVNAGSQDESGVLVTALHAKVSLVTNREVRRVFLGLAPESWNGVGNPVINESDYKTYQMFLKNVMYMTEQGYRRKLVKRVFRQGADEIMQFESIVKLVRHLVNHPGDVSFMSRREASKHPELKVIKTLWR